MEATEDPEVKPDLGEAAAHGVRWSAISRPAIELLQLGSMIVLSRLITPGEFGNFAVATIAIELACLAVGSGLGNAIVQRGVADREHLQAASALALTVGAAMTMATLLAARFLIPPIFGEETGSLTILLAPICMISAIGTVPMALLRRQMAFRRLSVIEIAGTASRVVVSVLLAIAGMAGEALVLGVVAGWLVTTVLAFASAPPPLPRFSRRPVRELLDFAVPMSLVSLTWVGFSNVDYAVIGARLGAVQTGLYFRAYTIAVEYQSKLGMVMSQVGFPVLARSADDSQMEHLRRQMVRSLTIVIFPLLVLLSISAPTLVPFVFGSEWSAAVGPVQVLALGGAATVVIDAAGTVMMASGRPRSLLLFGGGHFLAYGITVLLIAPLGLTAIAAGAAAVHIAFVVVSYALIRESSSQSVLGRLWGDISPATVASAGMALVTVPAAWALTVASLPALPWLLSLGLLGGLAYLATLRLGFASTWADQVAIAHRIVPIGRRRRVTAPALQST